MGSTFPQLSSGAVAQYPAAQITGQQAAVIHFIDGSDQRFLTQGKALRRWQIHLDQLNEDELAQVETFFAQQSGDYSRFSFADPFSGALVANCRLGTPLLETHYTGADAGTAALWIVEINE